MAEPKKVDLVSPLKTISQVMTAKLVEFTTAMKGGDSKAARKAISAENDIAALGRIIKRADTGFYA